MSSWKRRIGLKIQRDNLWKFERAFFFRKSFFFITTFAYSLNKFSIQPTRLNRSKMKIYTNLLLWNFYFRFHSISVAGVFFLFWSTQNSFFLSFLDTINNFIIRITLASINISILYMFLFALCIVHESLHFM